MSEEKKKPRTVTLEISPELDDLLRAAGRAVHITHNDLDEDGPLLAYLLKRGAREVVEYSVSADYRSVASISVAQLADVFGISDLEAARRNSRAVHEQQQKVLETTRSLFSAVQGLTQVHHLRKLANAEEVDALAESLKTTLAAHAEEKIKVVLALAFEQTTDDGAKIYRASVH